jgi:hypothetical protein
MEQLGGLTLSHETCRVQGEGVLALYNGVGLIKNKGNHDEILIF